MKVYINQEKIINSSFRISVVEVLAEQEVNVKEKTPTKKKGPVIR